MSLHYIVKYFVTHVGQWCGFCDTLLYTYTDGRRCDAYHRVTTVCIGAVDVKLPRHAFFTSVDIIAPMITVRVRHSRGEMYIGHGRLCVRACVCLSLAAFPHDCTDPDVKLGNGSGCPLVVHYWADLQSVQGFSYYDNIALKLNAKCQRVLVLALCLVEMNDDYDVSRANHAQY